MEARAAAGLTTLYEAKQIALGGFAGAHRFVTYRHEGMEQLIDCEFIAGCDGSHGVSRPTVIGKSVAPLRSVVLDAHSERFSRWFASLMHRMPGEEAMTITLREAEFDCLRNFEAAPFVSAKLKPGNKTPLIVTLHGLGVHYAFMLRGNALDLTEDGGYILVGAMGYNDQYEASRQIAPGPGCPGYSSAFLALVPARLMVPMAIRQ